MERLNPEESQGDDRICLIDICFGVDTDPCILLDFCGVYDGPAQSTSY
jgi:hypothetical protein